MRSALRLPPRRIGQPSAARPRPHCGAVSAAEGAKSALHWSVCMQRAKEHDLIHGHRATSLERAFELARGGECATVGDIRDKLRQEGLSPYDVIGPSLLRQLRELCVAAQAGRSEQTSNG